MSITSPDTAPVVPPTQEAGALLTETAIETPKLVTPEAELASLPPGEAMRRLADTSVDNRIGSAVSSTEKKRYAGPTPVLGPDGKFQRDGVNVVSDEDTGQDVLLKEEPAGLRTQERPSVDPIAETSEASGMQADIEEGEDREQPESVAAAPVTESRSSLNSEEQTRLAELEDAKKNGTINKEGRRERLALLRKQNETAVEKKEIDRLRQEEEDGIISDENLVKLESLEEKQRARESGEELPDAETKSDEEIAKEKIKEFEDLQMRAFEKMLAGDFEGANKEILDYNKLLADVEGFQVEAFQAEEARQFIEGIARPEKAKTPKETQRMRKIREKLQELARAEMQLRAQALIVEKMNEQEEDFKEAVRVAERDWNNEQNPVEKQKKFLVFSAQTMRLTRHQESTAIQKSLGRDARVMQRQVRGYIHRKLGLHKFVHNAAFGLGTALMQGGHGIANRYDSLFS